MFKRKISLLVFLLLSTVACIAAGHRFTLVIDPGHGGHDAGAVGAFSKEKDINLKTALAFGRYVERNCPDVNVIYTRKTDVFVTLHGRAEIANKAKADLFISIHTNALEKGKVARGFETYTLGMHRAADNLEVAKRENSVILVEKDYKQHYEGFDPNSAESYIIFEFLADHNMARSVELAKAVQANVCSVAGRPDKGVRQAGFLVLRETTMPSCLIELGFISTRDEEQYLNNEVNVDNMARGIYQAFATYKNKYDNGITVPFKVEAALNPERNTEHAVVEPAEVKKQMPSVEKKVGKQPDMPVQKPEEKKAQQQKIAQPEVESVQQVSAPVFKIQVFVAEKVLAANDSRMKGEKMGYYREGGMVKYTIGESTSFSEINQLRKTVAEKFPGAFVVAFRGGEKINVNDAIRESRNKK